MTVANHFNLIDEPWIPVADVGRVSLRQLFSHPEYRALGGNTVQKIALTKLLLAIAQAAYTPENDEDWGTLGSTGMAQKCLTYLDQWYDRFWLYGERPFLQMPAILPLINNRTETDKKVAKTKSQLKEAELKGLPKPFGSGLYPDLPSDNNTILTQSQFDRVLLDAEKAVFIVLLMNFAFGGKRIEKKLPPLSIGYREKSNSAKSSPSIGNHWGYLHSFLKTDTLLESLWLNLLTRQQIEGNRYWTSGLGVPPWEIMPMGEACQDAYNLKHSYMGCLVALSRFVLLKDEGIYYLEGIQYPSHKNGWREPSMAINDQGKKIKLLWVDPQKRPWRELTSLLSFINTTEQKGFNCQQITGGLLRARFKNTSVGIWSGGLKVRNNSGDQSVKQDDDFVESQISLPSNKTLEEDGLWFEQLKTEMAQLELLSSGIYKATFNFYKTQTMEGDKQAALASNLFWQLCEREFQNLVDACGNAEDQQVAQKSLRKKFAGFAHKAYDTFCPKETARQLDAWAKNRPNLSKYLNS